MVKRNSSQWNKAAKQANKVWKNQEQTRWELADILLSVFPWGPKEPGREQQLKLFISDAGIDISMNYVYQLITSARCFPPSQRKKACLSAHFALRNKQHLLVDGMSVAEAQKAAGLTPQPHHKHVMSATEAVNAAERFVRVALARAQDHDFDEALLEATGYLGAQIDELQRVLGMVVEIA